MNFLKKVVAPPVLCATVFATSVSTDDSTVNPEAGIITPSPSKVFGSEKRTLFGEKVAGLNACISAIPVDYIEGFNAKMTFLHAVSGQNNGTLDFEAVAKSYGLEYEEGKACPVNLEQVISDFNL